MADVLLHGSSSPINKNEIVNNADDRKVVIQFTDAEGSSVGPLLHLSLETTRGQLEQILNELLHERDEPAPYAFRLQGRNQTDQIEVNESLSTALLGLKGVTSETALRVAFYPLATFRVRPVTRCTASLQGHSEALLFVAFSPDCKHLASGSGDTTVRLWDLDTETPIRTLQGHSNWVMFVAWSPSSELLATAGMDKAVKVWRIDTSERDVTLKGHTKGVTCLAWLPLHLLRESQLVPTLASASLDMTIRIWDVVHAVTLKVLGSHTLPVTQIRFSGVESEIGHVLYSCSRDTTVKVWNVDSGQVETELKGHAHWVNALAVNTDPVLQAGPFDHVGACKGKPLPVLREIARKRFLAFLEKSCGGKEKVVSCSDDCTMFLWDPTITKPIARMTGHQRPVNDVRFSPDARFIASASFDKSVRLWDAVTGKYLAVLRGHVQAVYRVAWSPDSSCIVTASADSTVKVWDVKQKKLREDLPGHADEVYAIDWSLDGARVATGSKDRFLKIWRH